MFPLKRSIYKFGASDLAIGKIRRTRETNDDHKIKSLPTRLRQCQHDALEGACSLVFENMSKDKKKLVEVHVPTSNHKAKLHVLQCLSSDYVPDKKLLHCTAPLTLIHIEDRVRTNHWEMFASRKAIDVPVHVFISTGNPGNFVTPGHHESDWGGPGKGRIEQKK